jgi:hypothetical protein
MDDLARRIAETILRLAAASRLPDLRDPEQAVDALASMFTELLDLREAPTWRFRVSKGGADIDVPPIELLIGWISGGSLPDLAEWHLQAAGPPAWRIEQMVRHVTEQFEHYLAWTVGAVVEMVNSRLSGAGTDERLCPELGGYIRYGVNTVHALLLMSSGIRSRRLAHAVVADLPDELEPVHEDLRAWLAGMNIADWRERYHATSSEILDLLDFTRLRRRSLLKTLLEIGTVAVNLLEMAGGRPGPGHELSLEPLRDEPIPAPLAVYAGGALLGVITSQDHADIRAILDTGLDLTLEIDDSQGSLTLRLSLPLGDGDA